MPDIRLIVLISVLFVGGCSSLVDFGPKGPPPQVFTLEPLPRENTQSNQELRLLVEQPILSSALNSQRIAMRRGDLEIAYLAGARWEEPLEQLLQRHLAHSLDNRPSLAALGEGNLDLPVDYRLRLDLRAFNGVTTDIPGQPRIEIAWVATLLAGGTPDVLATRYFSLERSAGDDSPHVMAREFNTTVNQLAERMAEWIEEEIARVQAAAAS